MQNRLALVLNFFKPAMQNRLAMVLMLSLATIVFLVITHSLIANGGIPVHTKGIRGSGFSTRRHHLADPVFQKPLSCPEVIKRSEFAIVSILTCAQDQSSFANYQLSVMKLGASIQMTHSDLSADMILLLAGCFVGMQGLKIDHIGRAGWQTCFVPMIPGPISVPVHTNRFLMTGMFSKFHAWTLEEYDAVLLMDSDTLVLKSLSEVFLRTNRRMEIEDKTIAAVIQQKSMCSPVECFFTALERCHPVPDLETGFNAGILIIKPSRARFESLLQSIDAVDYDVNWAEQGLLNKWYPRGAYLELDKGYNFMTYQNPCGSFRWNHLLENASIVHFTNPKPWNCKWHGFMDAVVFNSFDTCRLWEDAPSFIY